MRNKISIFLSLVLGLASYSAQALSPSELLCVKNGKSPPIVFAVSEKSCGNQTQESQNICEEDALCMYLSDEIQKIVMSRYNSNSVGRHADTFDSITEKDKLEILTKMKSTEWYPSKLTCQATLQTGSKGQVTCPAPSHCKDDIRIHPAAATFDVDDLSAKVMPDVSHGHPHPFGSSQAGDAKK
jgi:hypothetical protein